MKDNILNLYYNPKYGLTGIKRFHNTIKDLGIEIPIIELKKILNNQNINQIFKPHFKKVSFPIFSFNRYSYQADLIELHNDIFDYKYCFNIINVNTKYAYSIPMKDKTAETVYNIFSSLLKIIPLKTLTTDNGSEFLNTKFQKLIKEYEIIHLLNEPGEHRKLGVIESFNRTLKVLIKKYLETTNTNDWSLQVHKFVDNYNNSIHSSIKMKPKDMGEEEENLYIFKKILQTIKLRKMIDKFDINDKVRIKIEKNSFEKEKYKWSKEIYTIVDFKGNKIVVKNKKNAIFFKKFDELQKIEYHEGKLKNEEDKDEELKKKIYTVEYIINHKVNNKGNILYKVKWKGYAINESTWEPEKNLRLYNLSKISEAEIEYWKKKKYLKKGRKRYKFNKETLEFDIIAKGN